MNEIESRSWIYDYGVFAEVEIASYKRVAERDAAKLRFFLLNFRTVLRNMKRLVYILSINHRQTGVNRGFVSHISACYKSTARLPSYGELESGLGAEGSHGPSKDMECKMRREDSSQFFAGGYRIKLFSLFVVCCCKGRISVGSTCLLSVL